MIQSADVVGAWSLREFVVRFSDDRAPVYPFGEDALGQLIYSETGQVNAVVSRADRQGAGESLETAARMTTEAKAHAFDSYLSYAGRYTIDEEGVVHHTELALVPDAVGVSRRRQASFEGGLLVLRYQRIAKSGVTRTYTLRWERP